MSTRPTHIVKHEYDASSKTMDITFHNGRKYRYHDVDPLHQSNMTAAINKSQYFASAIKPHRFTEVK